MTDDELAMAYVDGELDAIGAKRFKQRLAQEPRLAAAVAAHRRVNARIGQSFGAIADEPTPDHLANLLRSNVVRMPVRRQRVLIAGWAAGAMAAGLALGVFVAGVDRGPVASSNGQLLASGALDAGLNSELSGAKGSPRILVSFRDGSGSYCRVFSAEGLDGIACRDRAGWVLRQTRASVASGQRQNYRQAASASGEMLAAAQDMMAGDPLDPADEVKARSRGWK